MRVVIEHWQVPGSRVGLGSLRPADAFHPHHHLHPSTKPVLNSLAGLRAGLRSPRPPHRCWLPSASSLRFTSAAYFTGRSRSRRLCPARCNWHRSTDTEERRLCKNGHRCALPTFPQPLRRWLRLVILIVKHQICTTFQDTNRQVGKASARQSLPLAPRSPPSGSCRTSHRPTAPCATSPYALLAHLARQDLPRYRSLPLWVQQEAPHSQTGWGPGQVYLSLPQRLFA